MISPIIIYEVLHILVVFFFVKLDVKIFGLVLAPLVEVGITWHNCSPDLLAGLRGPTSKEREGRKKGKGEGKGKEGGGTGPLSKIHGSTPGKRGMDEG